jgi:hypothetical protein
VSLGRQKKKLRWTEGPTTPLVPTAKLVAKDAGCKPPFSHAGSSKVKESPFSTPLAPTAKPVVKDVGRKPPPSHADKVKGKVVSTSWPTKNVDSPYTNNTAVIVFNDDNKDVTGTALLHLKVGLNQLESTRDDRSEDTLQIATPELAINGQIRIDCLNNYSMGCGLTVVHS